MYVGTHWNVTEYSMGEVDKMEVGIQKLSEGGKVRMSMERYGKEPSFC